MPLTELTMKDYTGDPEYEFDCTALDAGERIVARMSELRMTEETLARRMGVRTDRVRSILQCGDRMTLKGIVAAATALGCRVTVQLTPDAALLRPVDADEHQRANDARLAERLTELHRTVETGEATPGERLERVVLAGGQFRDYSRDEYRKSWRMHDATRADLMGEDALAELEQGVAR